MGSFNETCALSGLHILPGDKVKVVFLTQNPYICSNGRVAQRGCYHSDNWFLRTPPISSKYDDYGLCELDKDNPVVRIVSDLFGKDAIEKPYGFNECHESPVLRDAGIEHYINAAWEGRLGVEDNFWKEEENGHLKRIDKLNDLMDKYPDGIPPEVVEKEMSDDPPVKEGISNIPTWKNVHKILEDGSLKLAINSKGGYNAQDVDYGVVIVHIVGSSYKGKNKLKLETAKDELSKHFDTKIIKIKHNDDLIIVTPKVVDENFISPIIGNIENPINSWETKRELPVLKVMIKEDVWDLYVANSRLNCDEIEELLDKNDVLSRLNIMTHFRTIPFECHPYTHLNFAHDSNYDTDEIKKGFLESIKVEHVLMCLHQAWYIPPLNGQETQWELHKDLNLGLASIIDSKIEEEKKWNEDFG